MAISVIPTDGHSHVIQIYSDITAEWTSGDDAKVVNWTTLATTDTVTHQIQLQSPSPFSEVDDHAEYGAVFYSTSNAFNATFQSGSHDDVRIQFINYGRLPNSRDTDFRPIEDGWPVFGLAHDLGKISGPTVPTVFSIGHVRDPALRYTSPEGRVQPRSLYFWSRFSAISDVISFFLRDYHNALFKAALLDARVEHDAKNISADYAAIVALSLRQAVGATEITISKRNDGSWNTSDVLVFLKGENYPNVTEHTDVNDESLKLEETTNMLIMVLSYAQKYNDYTQLRRYGTLFDQWTPTLIDESLIPGYQVTIDESLAGNLPNQTNLAIKGIIGIKALSLIAGILGNENKSSLYSEIAARYVDCWQGLSTSSTGKHLALNYGNSSSWGLFYNLYADRLLKLNLFPASVYQLQTAWYKTVALSFGVPVNSRFTYTKTDSQIWTAATVTDIATRDLFITSVKKYVSAGLSDQRDLYDASTGAAGDFRARPVVGGHLGRYLEPFKSSALIMSVKISDTALLVL
ncbi:hypothetical protein C0992_007797 [Termitomyces sp. T32_za158]|nr:hypothetical protein C0992_007797 [Termitomyces sp. T32_za158]